MDLSNAKRIAADERRSIEYTTDELNEAARMLAINGDFLSAYKCREAVEHQMRGLVHETKVSREPQQSDKRQQPRAVVKTVTVTLHYLFALVVGLNYGLIHLSLLVVHVVTTYFAWKISATWWVAAITFFTPPVAEIWWAFTTWMETGVFLNLFTLMIGGVVVLYVTQTLFAVLMFATEPK